MQILHLCVCGSRVCFSFSFSRHWRLFGPLDRQRGSHYSESVCVLCGFMVVFICVRSIFYPRLSVRRPLESSAEGTKTLWRTNPP